MKLVGPNVNAFVAWLFAVFLEFYASWFGHCMKMASTLEELAISYEKEIDVVIVKMVRSLMLIYSSKMLGFDSLSVCIMVGILCMVEISLGLLFTNDFCEII